MIILKQKSEIECMRRAGKVIAEIFKEIPGQIVPGKTTPKHLDFLCASIIQKRGAIPSFLGYKGSSEQPFPASACISVNEVVVHGVPNEIPLVEGDIVSVDVGVCVDGWHGDAAWTFPVGAVSPAVQKLLNVAKESLFQGIAKAKIGNRIGDISNAIQKYVEGHGCSVVRDLVGHGIGRNLHEEPSVPNFGKQKTGILLKEGLTICIEPMVNLGNYQVSTLEDGWSVATKDRQYSAHFEHMVAITRGGPDILSV